MSGQPLVSLCPPAPGSLAAAGLAWTTVRPLALKHLFVHPAISPRRLADLLGLGQMATAAVMRRLLATGDAVFGGSGAATGPDTLSLSEAGRQAAREAFRRSRYVGPMPVTLGEWRGRAAQQSPRAGRRRVDFDRAFAGLVVDRAVVDRLGPAAIDGRSVLLFGPPGNGKRAIAEAFAAAVCEASGPVWMPYAVLIGESVVTLADSVRHRPVQVHRPRSAGEPDRRYRCVERPIVTLAADGPPSELRPGSAAFASTRDGDAAATLAMPDAAAAAGGVLLVDADRTNPVPCRQLIDAAERAECDVALDLTSATVPIASTVVMTTANAMAATAALRRARHKVPVLPPTREAFARLVDRACRARSIPLEPQAAGILFDALYTARVTRLKGDSAGPRRTPRATDAADLVEIAVSICRFRKQRPTIKPSVLLDAARQFLPAA